MQHTPSHASHIDDELLSERLDGRLTATTRQHVDQHIADCAECAARYDGLRATRSALHALRAVTLPRDFRLDVTAHTPTSPRMLTPMRNAGFARLLSAAALICGLLFLAIGLFTLTVSNTVSQSAAGFASQAAPAAAATSCAPKTRCPSVNAGTAAGPTPTTTAAYGSVVPPATATMIPTRTSAGAGTYATSQAPVAANHNTAPSLLVIGFGVLTTLAGAFGLSHWGRPHPVA